MLNALNYVTTEPVVLAPDDLERVCVEFTEESNSSDRLRKCPGCMSDPQMICRMHTGDEDYYMEFFVSCGCKSGKPANSRRAAVNNWEGRIFSARA